MKTAYIAALTGACLYVVDDTLRATMIFMIMFGIGALVSFLIAEGKKEL